MSTAFLATEAGSLKACLSAAQLLAELDERLHTMSQPMMVLLCAIEYAAGLESCAEMKQAIGFSAEACEQLGATVRAMQTRVRQEMARERAAGCASGRAAAG